MPNVLEEFALLTEFSNATLDGTISSGICIWDWKTDDVLKSYNRLSFEPLPKRGGFFLANHQFKPIIWWLEQHLYFAGMMRPVACYGAEVNQALAVGTEKFGWVCQFIQFVQCPVIRHQSLSGGGVEVDKFVAEEIGDLFLGYRYNLEAVVRREPLFVGRRGFLLS